MRFSANCGQAQRRCHNRKANEVPAVANIGAGLTDRSGEDGREIHPGQERPERHRERTDDGNQSATWPGHGWDPPLDSLSNEIYPRQKPRQPLRVTVPGEEVETATR